MTESFNPSKRPRPARLRADKRPVAPLGFNADFGEVLSDFLTANQVSRLLKFFPTASRSQVEPDLQQVAGEYARSLNQPPQARGGVRHQLEMVAHLAWKLDQKRGNLEKVEAELNNLLSSLTEDAAMWLATILKLPWETFGCGWRGELPSPDVLVSAASSAVGQLTGGDYSDNNAHLAVVGLVILYEHYTGQPATWSNRQTGPMSIDGEYRLLAGSVCGRLIEAFFAIVDIDLPATKPHYAMNAYLENRRLQSAQSF